MKEARCRALMSLSDRKLQRKQVYEGQDETYRDLEEVHHQNVI